MALLYYFVPLQQTTTITSQAIHPILEQRKQHMSLLSLSLSLEYDPSLPLLFIFRIYADSVASSSVERYTPLSTLWSVQKPDPVQSYSSYLLQAAARGRTGANTIHLRKMSAA